MRRPESNTKSGGSRTWSFGSYCDAVSQKELIGFRAEDDDAGSAGGDGWVEKHTGEGADCAGFICDMSEPLCNGFVLGRLLRP
jgi:hypothetical protein